MEKLVDYYAHKMGVFAKHVGNDKLEKMFIEEVENAVGHSDGVGYDNLRKYFEKNIGEVSKQFSDDELVDLALNVIKEKSNSSRNTDIFSGDVPVEYHFELEDVVFTFPRKNASGARHNKFAGILVKDNYGSTKPGLQMKGNFINYYDREGGLVETSSGSKVFVKGSVAEDVEKAYDEAVAQLYDKPVDFKSKKTTFERLKLNKHNGYDVYVFDSSTFKNLAKVIFLGGNIDKNINIYTKENEEMVRVDVPSNKKVQNFDVYAARVHAIYIVDFKGKVLKDIV